jgi:hypothetical protein
MDVFVLDRARAHPDQLIVGVDPVAEAMAEASRRASAKAPGAASTMHCSFRHRWRRLNFPPSRTR